MGAALVEALLTASAVHALVPTLPVAAKGARICASFLLSVATLPLVDVRAILILRQLLTVLRLSRAILRLRRAILQLPWAILRLSRPILSLPELLPISGLYGLLAILCTRPLRERRFVDVTILGLVPLGAEIWSSEIRVVRRLVKIVRAVIVNVFSVDIVSIDVG